MADTKDFFTFGRREALKDWAINLSVLFLSAGLVGEAFSGFSIPLKAGVIVCGIILLLVGLAAVPDKEKGEV